MNKKKIIFSSLCSVVFLLYFARPKKNEEDVRKKTWTGVCVCDGVVVQQSFAFRLTLFSLFLLGVWQNYLFQPLKSILWLPRVGYEKKKSDRVSFRRTHTNWKWRQIESAEACVLCVVCKMQITWPISAVNFEFTIVSFWNLTCFRFELWLLFNFRENALWYSNCHYIHSSLTTYSIPVLNRGGVLWLLQRSSYWKFYVLTTW